MRSLLLAMTLCLGACTPDVTAWKGTWTGSVAFNFGRQPETIPGTLIINQGAQFIATSVSRGTPAMMSTCTLTVNMADATNLSFKAGDACDLSADGCTHRATLQTLTATRIAETMTMRGNGTVTSTCPSSGSSQSDFSLAGDAVRKP